MEEAFLTRVIREEEDHLEAPETGEDREINVMVMDAMQEMQVMEMMVKMVDLVKMEGKDQPSRLLQPRLHLLMIENHSS